MKTYEALTKYSGNPLLSFKPDSSRIQCVPKLREVNERIWSMFYNLEEIDSEHAGEFIHHVEYHIVGVFNSKYPFPPAANPHEIVLEFVVKDNFFNSTT